jgi:hypothetical protein
MVSGSSSHGSVSDEAVDDRDGSICGEGIEGTFGVDFRAGFISKESSLCLRGIFLAYRVGMLKDLFRVLRRLIDDRNFVDRWVDA